MNAVPTEPLQKALSDMTRELLTLLLAERRISVAEWNERVAPLLKAVSDVVEGTPIHARTYRQHASMWHEEPK